MIVAVFRTTMAPISDNIKISKAKQFMLVNIFVEDNESC